MQQGITACGIETPYEQLVEVLMDPLLQQGITACGIETAELQALAIFSPSSSAPCCNRALPLAVLKQYYFRRDTYINSTPLQQGITACGIESTI